MQTLRRATLLALMALISIGASASADVIFDNTLPGLPNNGVTLTGAPQLGLQVTAATGTSRVVTELDIGYTSQGFPATADLQAFLYANDGAGGTPGTLLWQSTVMQGVSLNSTNVLIAFSVPSIVVPDSFTFTSAITNVVGNVSVGWVPSTNAATVGTAVQAYVGSPGSWSALPTAFNTEARIITAAVPEPASAALLAIGLVGAVACGRRRLIPRD